MDAKWYIFVCTAVCLSLATTDNDKLMNATSQNNNYSSTTTRLPTATPFSSSNRPQSTHSLSNKTSGQNNNSKANEGNVSKDFPMDVLCATLPEEGGLKNQCISCFNDLSANPSKNSNEIRNCIQVLPSRFRTCLQHSSSNIDMQSIITCFKNKIKNNNAKFQRKAAESISKLKQMFESIDMQIAMEVTTFSVFLEEVIQNSTRSLQLIRPHLINCLDSEVRKKRDSQTIQRYKSDDQENSTGLFDELYNQVRCQAEGILKSDSAKDLLMKKLESYDTPLPSFLFQMICLEEKRKILKNTESKKIGNEK